MLFIMMQQVQPACIMALMASQHAWIIAPHSLSPEVQVMQTPSLVISHLHMPMVRLQVQTIMPFIMQQQLHMEPAMLMHRFWITPQAILSVVLHRIFMPPVHFSIFTVQRGTIMQFMPGALPGIMDPMPAGMLPVIAIDPIIELTMVHDLLRPTLRTALDSPDSRSKQFEPCFATHSAGMISAGGPDAITFWRFPIIRFGSRHRYRGAIH
jgi:hypothetical protein